METLKIESISTTTTAQVRFNTVNGCTVTAIYDLTNDGRFNRISISVTDGAVTAAHNEHNGYSAGLSINTLDATTEQITRTQNLVKQAIDLIKAQ